MACIGQIEVYAVAKDTHLAITLDVNRQELYDCFCISVAKELLIEQSKYSML